MQISMQMLADRLRAYRPEADIKNNKRQLQSMRLFSESLRYSASTVYLTQMEKEKIVCSNENDILILNAEDINEVSNEILDIFEFYRDKENQAAAKIENGCVEKELLEILSEMTGFFLILADASFYMRETAGPEEFAEQHQGLRGMIGEHMIPVEALKRINAEPKIRMHGIPPYLIEVPGLGTACTANLFANGHHEGWLVACKDTFAFTQGEMDLAACAAEIMERWFEKNIHAEEQSQKAGMLLELLGGKNAHDIRIRERLHTFSWMDTDRKQIFVIRIPEFYPIPSSTAGKRLEVLFPDAFIVQQEELVMLINYALNDEKDVRERMRKYLDEAELMAGESRIFCDIQELKQQADAAKTAARFAERFAEAAHADGPDETGTGGKKRILSFSDIAVPYAASILEKYAIPEFAHPKLHVLEEYDRRHASSLSETLRVFLEENCSHTAASKKLFIHRSTLLYRLERIQDLTGIDFADPEERIRLQISFYIADGR